MSRMKLKDLLPHGILPEAEEDAIAYLRGDHDRVEDLFDDFDQIKHARDSAQKKHLVEELCRLVRVHTTLEEEIFYPAVRAEIADDDLMNEARVEHESATRLVKELESMDADDDMLNAKMHVLCAYLKHHVREEEQNMFRKARDTSMDFRAIAARMRDRKLELEELPVPAQSGYKDRSGTTGPETRALR